MKKIDIVVTRYPCLVEYLREINLADETTKVVSHATPETIRGNNVCGVLPHSLSCLAASFTEIPLALPPELRGTELTIEQVRQYAGPPVTYKVTDLTTFSSLSSEITEIKRATSNNGRWGIVIVGPKGLSIDEPQEGRLVSLGVIEGHHTFQFFSEPGSSKWYLVRGDLTPLAGCEVVKSEDLQSSYYATLLVGGEFFAFRSYGRKRRSSTITCYYRGQRVDVPATVLAAMGLVPCTIEEVNTEAPPLTSALADTLTKAGLLV